MNLAPGKYFVALRDAPDRALAAFAWNGKHPEQVNDHLGLLPTDPQRFESQVLRMDLGGYYVVRKVGDEDQS